MGDFVKVHQTYSPVEADMIGDVLRSEDIPARVVGSRYGSVIGAGENVCLVRVEVPTEFFDRAEELVQSIVDADENLLAEQSEEEDDEEEAAAGPAPLSWMLAVGCSFAVIIPAAGHLYARRRWIWLVLLATWIWSLLQAFRFDWSTARVGLVGLGLVLVVDIIGGVIGVRAYNRGRRLGKVHQLACGAVMAACVVGGATVIGSHLPQPQPDVTYVPVIYDEPPYDFSRFPGDDEIDHFIERMNQLDDGFALPGQDAELPPDGGATE